MKMNIVMTIAKRKIEENVNPLTHLKIFSKK